MSPEQAEIDGAGRRHAQRRLLARRAALRTADRGAAFRGGGLQRNARKDRAGAADA